MAQGKDVPSDPFVLLPKAIYQPVVHGPNLGLSDAGINLNDGSYSTTKIYPVHIEGIPCGASEETIGNFYMQFNGNLCAYQLPEGAIAMRFRACDGFKPGVSDGLGGFYFDATFELTILEATGIYRDPFRAAITTWKIEFISSLTAISTNTAFALSSGAANRGSHTDPVVCKSYLSLACRMSFSWLMSIVSLNHRYNGSRELLQPPPDHLGGLQGRWS